MNKTASTTPILDLSLTILWADSALVTFTRGLIGWQRPFISANRKYLDYLTTISEKLEIPLEIDWKHIGALEALNIGALTKTEKIMRKAGLDDLFKRAAVVISFMALPADTHCALADSCMETRIASLAYNKKIAETYSAIGRQLFAGRNAAPQNDPLYDGLKKAYDIAVLAETDIVKHHWPHKSLLLSLNAA